MFHISQLRNCIAPPVKKAYMKELELTNDLMYEEKPVRILEEMERTTRSKVIRFYKVLGAPYGGRTYLGKGRFSEIQISISVS